MGLTEGFVPYQVLKKAGWMIIVWRLKITFGHVQQASSKIFWQILKQLLKLLTSTFIFLPLILTGKGAAVLRREMFTKTSLMRSFQWNLIHLPVTGVAQLSPKLCRNTVVVLKIPEVQQYQLQLPRSAYLPERWPGCLTQPTHFRAASFTVC